MLEQCSCHVKSIPLDETLHARTLRPRLSYSSSLIDSIISDLEEMRRGLSCTNDLLLCGTELFRRNLWEEHLICQTIIALDRIRSKIHDITSLSAIPAVLAPAISLVRTLSSALFKPAPECSQRLCVLAMNLGSIVIDSAILSCANCNFGSSNAESGRLLDEAESMADSEIARRYPNLGSPETDNN